MVTRGPQGLATINAGSVIIASGGFEETRRCSASTSALINR